MPLEYSTTAASTANNAAPSQVFFDATSLSNNSATFLVNKEPWYIEAFNLGGGDTITVQQVAGVGSGTVFQDFAPVGAVVQLTATTAKIRVDWPGYYRLVFAGASVSAITCVGFAGTMTHESIYKLTGGASGGGGGGGFILSGGSTATATTSFSGTSAAGVLTAGVTVSPDGGNIISAHANGVYASAASSSFLMPFTSETGDFSLGTAYSAYDSIAGGEGGSPATITLNDPTANAGQFYFVLNKDGLNPATLTAGAGVINSLSSNISMLPGMAVVLYSGVNSSDGWVMPNYTQVSLRAGNKLQWRYTASGAGGEDGLFVDNVQNVEVPVGGNTAGKATLVAGTIVVSSTKVNANSLIFLTAQSLGTVTVGQGLAVTTRVIGTSFTIKSQSATDTSTVAWLIVEPV